ncbi:peptidase, family M23/M37 domain protein [Methylococcus capsulatus str. Bath]|uniref:Peptidase, family M23/M37 domain protein n=1 Tax=Methylococcus capsulatus (strain ATCC 33009 / NCIMB 11132 / Bath) TaxID=243233 RepID=Q604K5_METCA|nr:peptidoglycan DD-metalloendopeptidase family protein [Methylococcus capsulatus]AAU91418.1 peptidase, family M23/M37 domain protein [Methylococcus capsulatus str. Bath]
MPQPVKLAVFAGFLMSWVAGQAISADEGDAAARLKAVRDRIASAEKELETIETRQGSVSAELRRVEERYGDLVHTLRLLEDKTAVQARRAAESNRRLTELQQAVLRQHKALASLARSAYALGGRQWLKLALNIDEPGRLARMMAYHGYLNRDHYARLEALQKDVAQVRALQDEAAADAGRLEALRERIEHEKVELDETRRERLEVLARLREERRGKDAELVRLKESEHRLEALVSSLREIVMDFTASLAAPRSFARRKGQLSWPAAGERVAQFGGQRMSGRWDGVVIRAPEGAPVKAVSEGRVVFSDWLRGYGLLTIVDHGDGYMSLYAFNQSVYKNVGDWVEAGEVIASVGSSGGQVEPGLYFGIREKGQALDPSQWCKD